MTATDSETNSESGVYQRKSVAGTKSKSQINKEYFQALEQWLNDVRSYTYSCSLLASLQYSMMSQTANGSFPTPTPNQTNFTSPPPPPHLPPFNQDYAMYWNPRPQQQQTNQDQGVEYRIPPLWKRFTAEFVDFTLLFLMKLAITVITVDFFNFVDLDDIDIVKKKNDEVGYKLAIEMTAGILLLEMIHRLMVCIYEGIFLHKGAQNRVGGATPGKTLMGIKVVLCNNVQQVGNDVNRVKVFPATNLGLGLSFARALLKNLVLPLLFPIFFPMFYNKFRRTGYDILCNSIVVEERLD